MLEGLVAQPWLRLLYHSSHDMVTYHLARETELICAAVRIMFQVRPRVCIVPNMEPELSWSSLTGPSFCTTVSERVYITDRTGFFVPTLRRVFGCL